MTYFPFQIGLANNNWRCDCDLVELYEYLHRESRIKIDDFICASPKKYADKPVLTLTKKEL